MRNNESTLPGLTDHVEMKAQLCKTLGAMSACNVMACIRVYIYNACPPCPAHDPSARAMDARARVYTHGICAENGRLSNGKQITL